MDDRLLVCLTHDEREEFEDSKGEEMVPSSALRSAFKRLAIARLAVAEERRSGTVRVDEAFLRETIECVATGMCAPCTLNCGETCEDKEFGPTPDECRAALLGHFNLAPDAGDEEVPT